MFEQSRPLDRVIIKEYDDQIKPRTKSERTPGVIDAKAFQEAHRIPLNLLKLLIESLKAWISAYARTEYWGEVQVCIDVMLYWSNVIYQNNPQPAFGKVLIDF